MMMKIWIIIALMFTTFVVSARTITVEIAFPKWGNASIALAEEIITDLNTVYEDTGVDFELYRATNGNTVKMSNSIEMVWAKNQFINDSGADLTLILTRSHSGNTVGYATMGYLSTSAAVAVYDYTSSNNVSGIANEIGHIFGLNHVKGDYVMHGVVVDYCTEWHPANITILKRL